MSKYFSAEKRARIIALSEQGLSYGEISTIEKCHRSTVLRTIKRNKQTNSNQDRPKSGRKSKLSARNERWIEREILLGRADNAVQMQKKLKEQMNIDVSAKTVRRTLKKKGFHAIHKVRKPFLSPKHKKSRLEFARRHKNWTVEDWKKVIWTDETKINLFGSDGKLYRWKKKGFELTEHDIQKTVKFGGGHLMIWGLMIWEGVGSAVALDDNLD